MKLSIPNKNNDNEYKAIVYGKAQISFFLKQAHIWNIPITGIIVSQLKVEMTKFSNENVINPIIRIEASKTNETCL